MKQATCNCKFDGDVTEGWKNNVDDSCFVSISRTKINVDLSGGVGVEGGGVVVVGGTDPK